MLTGWRLLSSSQNSEARILNPKALTFFFVSRWSRALAEVEFSFADPETGSFSLAKRPRGSGVGSCCFVFFFFFLRVGPVAALSGVAGIVRANVE